MTDGCQTAEFGLSFLYSNARIELDVMILEDSPYARVELCVMPQEAEFSCQENEHQSLFRLSLL